MSVPIALQLYSVREEAYDDFFGTLKKVKELGYDGVEFAGLFDNEPAMVRSFCEEIGLVPLSAHVPFDVLIADTQKAVSEYKDLGCGYIAVPYLTEDKRPGSDGFAPMLDGIRKIGGICAKYGMTLLYHNHDFEFKKLGDNYGLDIIYSQISEDLLQTELDTCWINVAGEYPAEYIRKYSGRAPVVHLKDFFMKELGGGRLYDLIGINNAEESSGEEAFSFMPLGRGCQDIPGILRACAESGTKWVVVEQDMPNKGNTAMNAAKQSKDYLKSIS